MRKKLLLVCFIAILALSVCHATDMKAALKDDDWDYNKKITKTESGFQYSVYPSKNGKEAWVYSVSMHGSKSSLSIPETIDGRRVTRIGDDGKDEYGYNDEPKNLFSIMEEYWDSQAGNWSRVKKVSIPDTVEVIEPYTFSGFGRIETIKIPKNVTKIDLYTFFRCKRLKKVILPDNLKKVNPLAFYRCTNLKTLKLSSKNKVFKLKGKYLISRKDNALVFAGVVGGKTLKIPNGIKSIKPFACNNVTAPVVHIPASVREMEQDALTSNYIKDVTVSVNNKVFQKDGQCIYRKKDKSLAVAMVDENCNLVISGKVEKLTPEYSMVNYKRWRYDYLKNVVFPENLKLVKYPGFIEVANAKNVYFTGKIPPKVPKSKKMKWIGYVQVPIFCNLYVPKDSVKAYKALYKKYEQEENVKWHTFDSSIPVIQ